MSSLASVLEHLKSGGVIAYPTEGVWGFGCDPNNQDAINNLLAIKERSYEKGLILISSKFEHFFQYSHAEEYKDKLMTKWPGVDRDDPDQDYSLFTNRPLVRC